MAISKKFAAITVVLVGLTPSCATHDEPTTNRQPFYKSSTSSPPVIPDSNNDEQYSRSSKLDNFTVSWSAKDGIDILGNEARLTRATLESMKIIQIAGIEHVYPGFNNAIKGSLRGAMEFDVSNRKGKDLVVSGSTRVRIVDTSGDDRKFLVSLCTSDSGVGVKTSSGQYRLSGMPANVLQFEFKRIQDPDASNESTQHIPSPQRRDHNPDSSDEGSSTWWPNENVFEGWSVNFSYDRSRYWDECEQWGYSVNPSLVPGERSDIYVDIPPEPLPAYPGW